METGYELIEKEQIKELKFPAEDVLRYPEDRNQRYADLARALSLGNLEHGKIRIYFEDNASKKVVETTVWGLTDHRVILKQGNSIPINRIIKSS
ncbi:MAG: hypothetical protein CFE24_00250 [Flavobacterium sp. BFFFF2]|nr:MAG: hypothetical protein CFE24_00250 [Flavobacterium sp. BFFFF2]